MQYQVIFNIGCMLQNFLYFQRVDHTFSPNLRFHRSYHQILIADNVWVRLRKDFSHEMFEIILVSNYELTFRAIAACLTQSEKAESIDMDEQGELSHIGESATPRTLAPPSFSVLVQSKTITWRQLSQLPFWHSINPPQAGSLLTRRSAAGKYLYPVSVVQ